MPQQAQQFSGLMQVLNDFCVATDSVFKRIYGNLNRRQQSLAEADSLQRAQSHARALQQRVRDQNVEIERLTKALASINEGVVMQGTDGRIVLMNEAARRLLDRTRNFWESPLGQMFQQAVDVEQNPPPLNGEQLQPIGTPLEVVINERTLAASMARVFSSYGEFLGTLMIISDVTEQSLGERLKTAFVTGMSHELMTPLTSIKSTSDLMLNLPEGKPPSRRLMEIISRNVGIMERMINELLDISEIAAGSFAVHREPVRLDREFGRVVSGLNKRIYEKDLKLKMQVINTDYLNVLGDAKRLRWAFHHLLDNAINYTPVGEIAVKMGYIQDERVLVKISDTGVGIADKDLVHIFERFYRGEARTREGKVIDPRGLGQGLFVAKAVAEAHGGELSVASVQGEGSTFTIAFPIPAQDSS